jgi:hypothetical protein
MQIQFPSEEQIETYVRPYLDFSVKLKGHQ